MSNKYKRVIACISDTHFGSIYAPMHQFKTFDGRTINPNVVQQQLNNVFEMCCSKIFQWEVDTVLLVGDLIQGLNRKEYGLDLVTANLEEQKQIATDYLAPICKGRKVYAVCGTDYHQSDDTDTEREIVKNLNGKFLGKLAWLKIPHSHRNINIAHESAKATIYPFSTMEREAALMLKAYADGKIPYKPDIVIRGHRHIFGHLHTTSYHFILVPSFQTWYPFKTQYYGALQSDIGMTLIAIDKLDRCIVHHYTQNITKQRVADKTFRI